MSLVINNYVSFTEVYVSYSSYQCNKLAPSLKTFEGQVKPKSFQTIDEMDFTACLKAVSYTHLRAHETLRYLV